jgi:hypothetical protein
MAAIDWLEIEGFKFTGDEARQASDFGEILFNHDLEPDDAFEMFKCENLKLGERLFLANKASDDKMAIMLFREPDDRIVGIIKKRLEKGRVENAGGIICRKRTDKGCSGFGSAQGVLRAHCPAVREGICKWRPRDRDCRRGKIQGRAVYQAVFKHRLLW